MGAGKGQLKALPFNCDDQATLTWRQRADLCVELMKTLMRPSEGGFSLADIGCGDQKLRLAIQAHGVHCRYHGYDLSPQGPGVQQFDVENESLPPTHDLAVLLGVVEYLVHVEHAFLRLAGRVPHLIVSHVIRQAGHYTSEQLEKLNWRNHFSEGEIASVLDQNGFVVIRRSMAPDRRTMLFACRSLLFAQDGTGRSG